VWQPNAAQWRLIWIVAVFVILCWPADNGKSLAVKAANWLADPTNSLPALPEQLPIALDDNADAVAAHDAQEAEYYRQYTGSRVTRLRMTLKTASDPLDPSTERQILAGIGILSALAIWRLNARTAR
jgi:hypothetical protein